MNIFSTNGELLYSGNRDTLEEEVLDAFSKRICLAKAKLNNLNFSRMKACLVGVDFREADLTGTNFSNTNLIDANFQTARLVQVNFTGASVECANFSEANLEGALFERAQASCCDFRHAYLEYSSFLDANIESAMFHGADLYMARHILRLPVGDPRGYDTVAVQRRSGDWMISSGCRWFTLERALRHWGDTEYRHNSIAKSYIKVLKRKFPELDVEARKQKFPQ